MKLIKKVPLAVSGLSLALAALGNLLLPYGDTVRYICGILSGALLCIFIVKLITEPGHVKEETKKPVVLSVMPTATMALMLLSTYIKPFVGSAALVVWYLAVAVHVGIMVLFAKRFVAGFKLQNVFPSWFVACVGIVTACVTSAAMDTKPLGRVIFVIGFGLYIIILPVVIYRMMKIKDMPEAARPTIAIFTAPMNLCIVGYLSAFEQPRPVFVYIMLSAACVFYIYVTINMVSLLKLKFYPTYAAFTFPYVISAISFRGANNILVENGIDFFSAVPKIAEFAAVIVVAYVLVRYTMFIFSKSPVK